MQGNGLCRCMRHMHTVEFESHLWMSYVGWIRTKLENWEADEGRGAFLGFCLSVLVMLIVQMVSALKWCCPHHCCPHCHVTEGLILLEAYIGQSQWLKSMHQIVCEFLCSAFLWRIAYLHFFLLFRSINDNPNKCIMDLQTS